MRQNEISLQWMQNFAKITAKFRLTQRKFASSLKKFPGEISSNFRENKERKTPNFVCTSFAQYWTVLGDVSCGRHFLVCFLFNGTIHDLTALNGYKATLVLVEVAFLIDGVLTSHATTRDEALRMSSEEERQRGLV